MLEQPLTNWTHAPVLFDLHQDCGETVPRFPCEWDGTWPVRAISRPAFQILRKLKCMCGVQQDKSGKWVSGCMPAAQYQSVVADLTATYWDHVNNFPRVESQIQKGTSPTRFPCCNPGCSPAPDCCHCANEGQRHLAEHLGI